jgi:hypothetical protein
LAAIRAFTQVAHLVGEFVEVELSKQNQRPQMSAVIAQIKAKGATLLIAKLDCLS